MKKAKLTAVVALLTATSALASDDRKLLEEARKYFQPLPK